MCGTSKMLHAHSFTSRLYTICARPLLVFARIKRLDKIPHLRLNQPNNNSPNNKNT